MALIAIVLLIVALLLYVVARSCRHADN